MPPLLAEDALRGVFEPYILFPAGTLHLLGYRLPCRLEFVLHDGVSFLIHSSEDHYRLVPPVEGNQEVLPVVDHVAGHRILDFRIETGFDQLTTSANRFHQGHRILRPIIGRRTTSIPTARPGHLCDLSSASIKDVAHIADVGIPILL